MLSKIALAVILANATALRVQNRPLQTREDDGYRFDDEIGTYSPTKMTSNGMMPNGEGFNQIHANLDCFKNKRVFFMGDSTVQEILWRSLLLMNKTTESAWMKIPVTECHNVDCLKLAKNKVKIAKAHARCGSNSLETCQKELSVVEEAHFGFDWVWSGGKNPTNNFGGLSHAIYDEEWLSMFHNATQSKYDAMVFTSGNHDKFRDATEKAAYDKALDDILDMLEPLAPKGVFLQTSDALGHSHLEQQTPLTVNREKLQARSSKWTVIDRSEIHKEDHCSHIKYKNSRSPNYYYQFLPECDKVVEAMRQAIC